MEVADNIRSDLIKLVPASILQETVSYCFFDNHPRDSRGLDITVCTGLGEVFQIYQREIVSSILVQNISNVKEIQGVRNENSDLYYLMVADNELIILSTKDTLHVHRRIRNMESYEMADEQCTGQPYLKVIRRDDAVPWRFDNNFNLAEIIIPAKNVHTSDTSPVVTMLLRKLTEAKYSVKNNESALNEFTKLKQTAAYALYDKEDPNVDDSMFKIDPSQISKALRIKTLKPFVKLYNMKIIVLLKIYNDNDVAIDNVHLLLHGKSKQSVTYTTKIFKAFQAPPYWEEKSSHSIKSSEECSILAIVDLKELKYTITSMIDFDAAISYTKLGNSNLLPLENILVSAMDTMGEKFDALLSVYEDDKDKILAVLATSEKTDLVLRHIKQKNSPHVNLYEAFCKHLHMEVFAEMKNVIIHKVSQYHILYGLLIIFDKTEDFIGHTYNIQVYSRSNAQLLAFIHYMYDGLPYRIIATLPDCNITSKCEEFANYNETAKENLEIDYTDLANSVINQTKIILDFFDRCMIRMNVSTNEEVQNKIGEEIHLISLGVPEYLKFRNQILSESMNGIDGFRVKKILDDDDKGSMSVHE